MLQGKYAIAIIAWCFADIATGLNDTEMINVECVRGLRAPTRDTRLATAADNHWVVVLPHSQSIPIVDHSVDLVSTTLAPRQTMHTHGKRRA